MRNEAYRQAIWGRLRGRPHLLPVFGPVVDKLREYNPDYYVVLNVKRNMQKAEGLTYDKWVPIPPGVTPYYNAWYEVRKLSAPAWLDQGLALPFGPLDDRAIPYVLERDTEIHGGEVFRRLAADEESNEVRLEKERKDMVHDIASDMVTAAKLDTWGSSVFGPKGA